MNATGGGYLLDNRTTEAGERFEALAAIFDPTTFRHLGALGVAAGSRCWEVGAGGPSRGALAGGASRPDRTRARDRHRSHLADGGGRNEIAPDAAAIEVRRHDVANDPPPKNRRRRLRHRACAPVAGAPARPRTGAAHAGAGTASGRCAADRGRRSGAATARLHRSAQPGRGAREPAAHAAFARCWRNGAPSSPSVAGCRASCARPGSRRSPPTPTSRWRCRRARVSRRRRSDSSAASSCATASRPTPTSTRTWPPSPPATSTSHSPR